MSRPLVSIITPTWQRHDLLRCCMENVRAQTYRPIEHIIVSDGPDPQLEGVGWEIEDSWLERDFDDTGHRYYIYSLGRNWSTLLPDSFCAAPLTVGMLIADGAYQMWLADDERMESDHVAGLVDALEASGADFAYSRVELTWRDDPGRREIIGTDPPTFGQITNVLYRTETLKLGLYPFGERMHSDWACISRWLSRGARYAFVPRVTLTHRVDH